MPDHLTQQNETLSILREELASLPKETAAVLKVSEETITRDWRIARGWLLSEMKGA